MYDWSEFDSELEKHEYMKQLCKKKSMSECGHYIVGSTN